MSDNRKYNSFAGMSPLAQLLASIVIITGIGMVLMIVFIIAGGFLFKLDFSSLSGSLLDNTAPQNILFMRLILLGQDLCIFIIPGLYILKKLDEGNDSRVSYLSVPLVKEIGFVIILSACLFPVIGFAGEINSRVVFPEWLAGVEKWMQNKENELDDVMKVLSVSDTFVIMLFNLLMMAILPAIGEEIVFRGIIQKIFMRLFRNDHTGIWIAAILFSAIHLQFYGFLPRLILGLVFGYLFYWSGTLWLPVLAHFLNNGVIVVAEYINGGSSFAEKTNDPLWQMILMLPIPLIIGWFILKYFSEKERNKSFNFEDNNESPSG